MSIFDELFGDMGPAYTPLVYAHLQVQAEKGNEAAKRLIYGDLIQDAGPRPGDVVIAKDRTWVWDSSDGKDWVWWSPEGRDSIPADELEDYEPVIWQGRREMPAAALELWDAVSWALGELRLCEQKTNARTGAKYYDPLVCTDVGELIELFRAASQAEEAEQ